MDFPMKRPKSSIFSWDFHGMTLYKPTIFHGFSHGNQPIFGRSNRVDPGSRAVLPVPRDAIPFLRGGDLISPQGPWRFFVFLGKCGENVGKILEKLWENIGKLGKFGKFGKLGN